MRKLVRGLWLTYIRKFGETTRPPGWWDKHLYKYGVSDKNTISPTKSVETSIYHYNSVENTLLRAIAQLHICVEGASVFDIGCGSGHWLNFYRRLGATRFVGCDVSKIAITHLESVNHVNKYDGLHCMEANDALNLDDTKFTIVNAIGVMFHIVDDTKWADTITSVYNKLEPHGVFMVGGHFGIVDNNVQFHNNTIDKRLRSKKHWINALQNAGFSKFLFLKNYSYLFYYDTLPESHILVAIK
jgi:SAM-dependent methyltransferase